MTNIPATRSTEQPDLTPDITSLTGRVAVVTGAAQGIGEAIALTLGRFGADVAVCDRSADGLRSTVTELEGMGRRVVSSLMDVRDPDAVDAFLSVVAEEHGKVDILVNNAGGGFHAPFMEVSPKGQAALVNENFAQVTTFIRGTVPLMTDGGSIVNITSIEAHRAGPGFGVYSAMKAAVENLSKTLSLELSDRRIRVNCVAPDMIPTPGDAGLSVASGALGGDTAETAAHAQPWPIGGTTWDAAASVLFLASDLSRFVTGTTIHLDGGTFAASGWKRAPDGEGGHTWLL